MSARLTLLFAVAAGAAVGNLTGRSRCLTSLPGTCGHRRSPLAERLTTVAGQILTPLAGDLADDAHRGRVVGTVVSGILAGILVSRTISGFVAGSAGWRTIFAVAAVLDVLLAMLLYRASPPLAPKTRLAYPALVASVWQVVRRERAVTAGRAGRLHDRGLSLPATGAAWVLALIAFVVACSAAARSSSGRLAGEARSSLPMRNARMPFQ